MADAGDIYAFKRYITVALGHTMLAQNALALQTAQK